MKKAMYLALASAFAAAVVLLTVSADDEGKSRGRGNDSDALSSATVSFGGWMVADPNDPSTAIDRFPQNQVPPPGIDTQFPRNLNFHALTPEIATIKAGGTVNFIIGGFHVIAIYDDGTKPEDINSALVVQNRPAPPPIIDDPNNRIYRGLDPAILGLAGQDRVEVVQFDRPGVYLVICAVQPHFLEGMFGYVRVLPNNDRKKEDGNGRHGHDH